MSERDAETWVKLREPYEKIWAPYYIEYVLNPPPAEGPDAMDRLIADPRAGIDPSWMIKSPLEALRDLFESDALIAMLLRNMQSAANARPSEVGMGLHVLFHALGAPALRWVLGGTHNFAHAAVKILLADGGKIFTQHEVDRVIVENGKAQGIMLADGSRIEAKRLVVRSSMRGFRASTVVTGRYPSWRVTKPRSRIYMPRDRLGLPTAGASTGRAITVTRSLRQTLVWPNHGKSTAAGGREKAIPNLLTPLNGISALTKLYTGSKQFLTY